MQLSLRSTGRAVGCVALIAVCVGLAVPGQAAGAVVNSSADDSDGACTAEHCTLREAIEATNASVDDLIEFSLAGTGVPEIVVGSPLPAIADRLEIDGLAGLAPGVRLQGTAAAGNGLELRAGADGSLVQGLVIGGFPGNGIDIDGADVGVYNSYVGTASDGSGSSPTDGNGGHGVAIRDADGGATDSLISGNGGDGIRAVRSNLGLNSNRIGSDLSGTVAVGNAGSGVRLEGDGSEAFIWRNSVVANGLHGVHMTGAAGGTLQESHFGKEGLGNAGAGVLIEDTPAVLVGGFNTTHFLQANTMIGNGGDGVRISGSASEGTSVFGNRIWLNDGSGVVIDNAPRNRVGTSLTFSTASGAVNFIERNGAHGVHIVGPGSYGNVVRGNLIGREQFGNAFHGNALDGVLIEQGASANDVGGTGVGQGNVIADNARGVRVLGNSSGNRVLGNQILSNEGLGIDLAPSDVVNPNDAGDADGPGPNGLQNFPTLTGASSTGDTVTITGSLDSEPRRFFDQPWRYRLEFFVSPACDASGSGEGHEQLGSLELTVGATGTATFSVAASFARPVLPGEAVTATATNQSGDTSEFSACAPVTEPTATPQAQPTPPPAGSPPDPRPRFLEATLSNRLLRVGSKSTPRRGVAGAAPVGTTFRYHLSESATVRIAIARRHPAAQAGRTRWIRQGRLVRRSHQGLNRVRFSGRIGRRALRPGRHRATLIAIDDTGQRTRPVRLRFRVVADRT